MTITCTIWRWRALDNLLSNLDTFQHAVRGSRSLTEPGVYLQMQIANKEVAHRILVHYNLRLIAAIALRYGGQGIDVEDLIAEGTKGLIRAIDGFDPTKGNRFSTYGYLWIRQSIKRFIGNHSRLVRLPMHVLEVSSCCNVHYGSDDLSITSAQCCSINIRALSYSHLYSHNFVIPSHTPPTRELKLVWLVYSMHL